MPKTLVQPDSRGRIALGSALTAEQYIVNVLDNGNVLLEPAVVMSQADYELRSQPDVLDRVRNAIEHPETLIAGKSRRQRV